MFVAAILYSAALVSERKPKLLAKMACAPEEKEIDRLKNIIEAKQFSCVYRELHFTIFYKPNYAIIQCIVVLQAPLASILYMVDCPSFTIALMIGFVFKLIWCTLLLLDLRAFEEQRSKDISRLCVELDKLI